jgi:SAM-dependent MidA family methyltransferase
MARSPLLRPRSRGNPRVEAELRRRLRGRGRIPFAEFMEIALYLPDAGYYEATVGPGREGDFLTSPEAHPAFGALLARLVQALWLALEAPNPFHLIEYGAGTGSLCRQVLQAAPRVSADFDRALSYIIIERSAFLRALQQAALLDLVTRVSWLRPEDGDAFPCGCVMANEVVDAISVHRVRMHGGLRERYVAMAADRYLEVDGAPSLPELAAYFEAAAVWPPERAMAEVCLGARPWLEEAAGRLAQGYIVIVDYGAPAAQLYGAATPRGGLKCFSRHGWTDDPYDRPGLQDITAPVDFTHLRQVGEELGLEPEPPIAQGDLLQALGLRAALAAVESRAGLPVVERERNRRAMLSLADPQGLGGFQVLLHRKGAPRPRLAPRDVEHSPWVPLLPTAREEW